MKVEPISTQVLIQILEMADEKVKNGVILPDTDYRDREFGKILAIGAGADPDLSAGTVVCFPSGEGTFIDHEVDGKTQKCILLEFALIKYIVEQEQ